MGAKQLTLPRVGPRFKGHDKGERAHLYRTMELLGAVEGRALANAEDEEYEDWRAADAELARCVEQAESFYAMVIAPHCKRWWLDC